MTLRRSARWILREFIETLKIGWAGLALVLVNESFLLLFLAYLVLVVLLKTWAWRRTTIQVGGDAVVLEVRGATTRRESVARSAVETLVVSAEMLDRLCGLQTLQLTTNDDSNNLVLDGLSPQSVRDIGASLETEVSEKASDVRVIAAFRPGWFGYSLLTPIGWAGVVGVAFLANRIGDRFVSQFDGLSAQARAALAHIATPLLIVLGVASGVAIVLFSYAARYGGFRLEESPGTGSGEDPLLIYRRGLLETKAITFARSRIRGIRLTEPIPLRWAKGARLHAEIVGHKDIELLPPTARTFALHIARDVLSHHGLDAVAAVSAGGRLAAHGRAARRVSLQESATVPLVLIVAAAGAAVINAESSFLVILALVLLIVRLCYTWIVSGRRASAWGRHSNQPLVLAQSHPRLARNLSITTCDSALGVRTRQSWRQRRAGVADLRIRSNAGDGALALDCLPVIAATNLAVCLCPVAATFARPVSPPADPEHALARFERFGTLHHGMGMTT